MRRILTVLAATLLVVPSSFADPSWQTMAGHMAQGRMQHTMIVGTTDFFPFVFALGGLHCSGDPVVTCTELNTVAATTDGQVWSAIPMAPMRSAHYGHTVTLLPSFNVLTNGLLVVGSQSPF